MARSAVTSVNLKLFTKEEDSMPKAEVERLLTAEEVAERLQVKVETLHQWRWKGKGPRAVKAGPKFVRYRPSDVNEWLEAYLEHDQEELAQTPPAA